MERSSAPEPMTTVFQFFQKHSQAIARVWLVLKVLAILATLFGTVLYATNSTRIAAIENVSDDFFHVAAAQGDLLRQTESMIASTYRTNELPARQELLTIRESAGKLLAALSGFEAPSSTIRQSRDAYRREVERLMGQINVYGGSVDDYQSVQNASVLVSNTGGDFRSSVEDFTGGTWRSFWGVW